MIELSNAELDGIVVHKVGNSAHDEGLQINDKKVSFGGEETREYLMQYFLTPFGNNEVYNFSHSSELSFNEVYGFVKSVFDNPDQLYEASVDIAKHLHQEATHPNINGGELSVCYFKNCSFDGEMCNAIGLFKTENKDVFLQFDKRSDLVNIHHEKGVSINKLDKGCMIFDLEGDKGYKVCVIDTKSKDTQYWKSDFLRIKPAADEFHFTTDFLSITKEYVTEKLSEDFEVDKTDKIDLLNRSVEYFKSNETFDKNDFEKEVFQDEEVIKSFREFDNVYREDNEIELSDNFDISSQAVKKQARVFKSVLKLDKNFHIYIHGDKKMIEKGTESDGRKFYKIYYKDEQ